MASCTDISSVTTETNKHDNLSETPENDEDKEKVIPSKSDDADELHNKSDVKGVSSLNDVNLLNETPSSWNCSKSECSNSRSSNPSIHTFEEKPVNVVKHTHNDPKLSALDHSFPLSPETWTVTSDSQLWLECCQYNNTFRAYGGNVRSFQPNSSKVSSNHLPSSNHLYSSQGTTPCPQIHRGNNANSVNYNRNSQYVVHLHVNPGETISFDMGDHVQLIQGPATVRMVSSNNTPPVPMPVQVPPGHMVQQIVDEHGTLRHIILSPQPPVVVTVGNPYNGTASGNVTSPVSGTTPFYLYPHPPYSVPAQFPPHMQPTLGTQGLHNSVDPMHLHQTNGHSSNSGVPDSSSSMHSSTFKDERTQRQFFKLKKRLESRQKDAAFPSPNVQDAVEKSQGEIQQSDAVSKTKAFEKESRVQEALSSIEAPNVSDVTATSALLRWKTVDLNLESDCDLKVSEIYYVLLLSDKSRDTKPKLSYRGKATESTLSDLKPASSYVVRVQAELNGHSGSPSESATFKTLSCEPDAPQPPKLLARTKTTISLKWNAAVDNGAKISAYILEFDEGTGSDNFVELFNGLQKQYKATKLKSSTCYRFRLAAINDHGKSSYSEISCFSTSGSAPSQPLPPVLKEAFINKLCLEWQSRPNDDNYTLQMEDDSTLHGFLPVYNGKDTSYICLHLRRNTDYKFRLSASNDEGSSPWSHIVVYSTLPDKPDKPGKPYLKGRAHSTFFKVAWDPPKDDGGCPVTEYNLEMNSEDGFCSIYSGEELEFICENLQPGKSYEFRVCCSSQGGKSIFSEVGTIATVPVVPGKCAPPRLQGKPKAISLHLAWSRPDYDGGSEVLEFEVEVTYPDGSSRIAYKNPGTDCVVAGLLPGRQYQFRVRAYNKVGAGHWSDFFEVMSGAGIPGIPENCQAVPRSPHCIYVSWLEPASNGALITEYRLESKHDEKEFELVYSGPLSYTEVKSLIPATLYHYQVQAINSAGAGPFSECFSCQTLPSSPGSVSTANVKSIVGASTIALSWKEPNNHGSPILNYNVEIGDVLHTTDDDKPEICIEGLVPETTYKIRIQAINSVGPGPFSNSMKIVTRGLPPLPPILECCGYSHNSLRLKWGDGKNLDLKSYTLELENPQTKRFIPIYQGPGHTHKVTKLQEMTSYNFRIYASNEEGDGSCSDVFTFTTQRALPPALKAPKVSNVTETSCFVEWMPGKPIGDDMLSYKLQLGTKESDFHVFYTGIQTGFTVHNLLPGTEYSVRVAGVRHCSDGELPGPYSPCTVFCTNFVELSELNSPKMFSFTSCFKNRQPLSDQHWAMIILCIFTFIAFCIAMIIQRVISYTTSSS